MQTAEARTSGEGVEILPADGFADGAAAFSKKGDLFAKSGGEQWQEGFAFGEELLGALDLEADEVAEIIADGSGAELCLGDAEALHVVGGEIDAVAFEDVAADILPEVDELQGGADFVAELLAEFVAVAAHVEDESANGVGASGAVIDELRKIGVAGDVLVLFEGADKIGERLHGDVVSGDGGGEGGEDGGGGVGSRGGTVERFVAVLQLHAKRGEKLEGFGGIADFIAKIIRDAAESINIAEILTEMFWQQEHGDDGEVFVMRMGEPPRVLFRGRDVSNRFKSRADRFRSTRRKAQTLGIAECWFLSRGRHFHLGGNYNRIVTRLGMAGRADLFGLVAATLPRAWRRSIIPGAGNRR